MVVGNCDGRQDEVEVLQPPETLTLSKVEVRASIEDDFAAVRILRTTKG